MFIYVPLTTAKFLHRTIFYLFFHTAFLNTSILALLVLLTILSTSFPRKLHISRSMTNRQQMLNLLHYPPGCTSTDSVILKLRQQLLLSFLVICIILCLAWASYRTSVWRQRLDLSFNHPGISFLILARHFLFSAKVIMLQKGNKMWRESVGGRFHGVLLSKQTLKQTDLFLLTVGEWEGLFFLQSFG